MLSSRILSHAALFGSRIALAVFTARAEAATYAVLHNFTGAPSDGAEPLADLTLDDAGNIYGTTYAGGSAGGCADGGEHCGTVFKIAPDGSETVLLNFGGGNGAHPVAGVALERSTGNLIGSTANGGTSANCYDGCGIIYRLTPGGSQTVLHDFDGSDGRAPIGKLTGDGTGHFYGVAQLGGPSDMGTIYRVGDDGSFVVLHSFTGSEGGVPAGKLVRDQAGNLYGVTAVGGKYTNCYAGCGTVFKLTPDGTLITLYAFTGDEDGRYPEGRLARDKAGNLYGTTTSGGKPHQLGDGVVFRLTPGRYRNRAVQIQTS